MTTMTRTEYTMTEAQLETLLDACKPTPCMLLSGGQRMGPTPQENANAAWRALGDEMGFKFETVRPIPGSCEKHFTAEPKGEPA